MKKPNPGKEEAIQCDTARLTVLRGPLLVSLLTFVFSERVKKVYRIENEEIE